MLVSFDVVGDLLRGVLVHEANGTLDTRSGVCTGLRSWFLEHGCAYGVRGWMWDMIFTIGPWLHIQRLLRGLRKLHERTLQVSLFTLDRIVMFQLRRHGGLMRS